jgi:hypothetical protein
MDAGIKTEAAGDTTIGQTSTDYAAPAEKQATRTEIRGLEETKPTRHFRAYWKGKGYTTEQIKERWSATEAAKLAGKKQLPRDWKPTESLDAAPKRSTLETPPDFILQRPADAAPESDVLELEEEKPKKEYLVPTSEEEAREMRIFGRLANNQSQLWRECPDFQALTMVVYKLFERFDLQKELDECAEIAQAAAPIVHHILRIEGESKPSIFTDALLLGLLVYSSVKG